LRFAGYEPIEAGDGQSGMDMATTRQFDLLLLDLVLPKRDGLDILREVRRLRPALPVIILTARGDEAHRVRGLSDGADDYVVKPFSVKELLARVEAVLRRSAERPTAVSRIDIPGGTIDLRRREVRFAGGGRAELSEREAELIGYLAANSGRAIGREELLANVWRISPRGLTTRAIDMHVTRLREKLRDGSAEPKILLTVRGKGYMFQCTRVEARSTQD
jgi:DNA-binding response OmpR family regulator